MGCPKYVLPDDFNEIAASYLRREVKCTDVAESLNMVIEAFLKYVHLK